VSDSISESVRAHLVSDVPVGVFLSGGIDSSAVAGHMVESFPAGGLTGITVEFKEFSGSRLDEAPVAKRVAAYYGISQVTRRVEGREFFDDLPRILSAMDQPTIDGINTWYASKAAAESGLKVVMSGIGGDELFQGYSIFSDAARLLRFRKLFPMAAQIISFLGYMQYRRTGLKKWLSVEAMTRDPMSLWLLKRSLPDIIDVTADFKQELFDWLARISAENWEVSQNPDSLIGDARLLLGLIESKTYLRNQLLRDGDWASMDHGVELRTPLVDIRLLESLVPYIAQFERFGNKSLLSNSPSKVVPGFVTCRKKTGFSIPIDKWVRSAHELPGRWQAIVEENFFLE
jgi:asparagine synthase (glutamine-hydrolysing)